MKPSESAFLLLFQKRSEKIFTRRYCRRYCRLRRTSHAAPSNLSSFQRLRLQQKLACPNQACLLSFSEYVILYLDNLNVAHFLLSNLARADSSRNVLFGAPSAADGIPDRVDHIDLQTTDSVKTPLVIVGAASISTTTAPTVTAQTPNQIWVAGVATTLTLSAKTFTDPQTQPLTYTATSATGTALPTWLKFTAATDSFSGTDPAGAAPVTVRVTATDTSGLSVSESFTISLAQAPQVVRQTATQYFAAGQAQSFTLDPSTFADPQNTALTYAATLASGLWWPTSSASG